MRFDGVQNIYYSFFPKKLNKGFVVPAVVLVAFFLATGAFFFVSFATFGLATGGLFIRAGLDVEVVGGGGCITSSFSSSL